MVKTSLFPSSLSPQRPGKASVPHRWDVDSRQPRYQGDSHPKQTSPVTSSWIKSGWSAACQRNELCDLTGLRDETASEWGWRVAQVFLLVWEAISKFSFLTGWEASQLDSACCNSNPQAIFNQSRSKYCCYFVAYDASTFSFIVPVAFCHFLLNVVDHLFFYKRAFGPSLTSTFRLPGCLGCSGRRLLGWTILLKQTACLKCRAFCSLVVTNEPGGTKWCH